MKVKFSISIFVFLLLGWADAQVFVGLRKETTALTVTPASPVYVVAAGSVVFTASKGMGVYGWSITGPAAADNAAINNNISNPKDPDATYDARDTAYATDTLTVTSPGYSNVTRSIVTYDSLAISPTTAAVGVNLTQSFSAAGGCLNGANCVGGSYAYSIASGIGSIHPTTGLYTAPAGPGAAVVQVADSIGNVATANVTVTNTLTISPTTARVAVYSTGLFSAILGTAPYTFTVPVGTGTVGCQSLLNGAHTAGVTTITVLNTTGCPSVGSIVVGSEIICYTGITGTTFTGAVRGCSGSTAAAYATSTPYNATQAVYTAPTMIGSATVRVTDTGLPTAASADASVSIIRPVDVKVGQYSACVLYDEGSVKCWGIGGTGRLGIGSTATIGDSGTEVGVANAFVNLGTGRTAIQISVGHTHACAILDNSSLKCWGNGGSGRLGYGSTTSLGDVSTEMGDGLAAVNLGTGKTATEVYAFGAHTCAILNDATVKCWGQNTYGQLGYENTTNYGSAAGQMGDSLPVVNLGTGRTAVKLVGGLDYTCALLDNATVKCWGRNQRGQLGKDLPTTDNLGDGLGEMGDSLTTIDIGAGRTALDIVGLYETVCVRRDNATMICWGRNNRGQVGKGNNAGANANIGDAVGEMAGIANINMGAGFGTLAKIYGNGQSVCAEDTVNVVKCWGYNAFGQLLLGTTANALAPPATAVNFGTGLVISKMNGSFDTACALLTNNRIKCFGRGRTNTTTVNGVLLNGSVINNLGDAAGELGDSLPYVNH